MANSSAICKRKTFALITGASRGIGREIALQLANIVGNGSAFVITARSEKELEIMNEDLKKINSTIDVTVVIADLSKKISDQMSIFETKLTSIKESYVEFDILLVIHNAGSVGTINCRCEELSDEADWHQYLQMNLTSTICLNNLLLRIFDKTVVKYQRYVVNITSLIAIKAVPSLAQYSVGKAAREAFFRILAVENSDVRVLSYSPGPVSTAISYDEATRKRFQRRPGSPDSNDTLNRRVLTPKETVTTLVRLLNEDNFESGSRIDYFDV